MVEHADVVVIGAGLGGLATAVTVAGAGRRALVLEQHTLPGGYATSFQRGPYRFDASLHALNGLTPGSGLEAMYRELGILDRVRLQRLDPLYLARFPDRDVVAHADPQRYESELIGQFPGEALRIRSYLDETLAVLRDATRAGDDNATGRAPSPMEFLAWYPALVRVSGETWAQSIGRHVDDPQLRAALGPLWCYGGLPPELLSGLIGMLMVADYGHRGGWYPEGGSAALSWALERELRERGGDVLYSQTVTGFEQRDGRIVAVTTAEGLRVEADVVVSNASPPTTMVDLVGREHLPADYLARVERPTPSYATFALFLGLSRDVFGEQGLPHELFISPGYDLHAQWQASRAGDLDRAFMAVTDYTTVDPGCAPPGQGVVVVMVDMAWDYEDVWGTGGDLTDYHANPRYRTIKERVADDVVRVVNASVPGFADAVRYREASTPLTNFSYTRNPHGAIIGYENTPANTGIGWLPQTTPIPNLFLAGAWTNTGGQNPAMQSGVTAAHLALVAAVPVA